MKSFFNGDRVRLIPELDPHEDRPVGEIVGKNTTTTLIIKFDGDEYLKLLDREMIELAPSSV